MIDIEGGVVDLVKVFQEKMLTVICPLARNSCLEENKYEDRFPE